MKSSKLLHGVLVLAAALVGLFVLNYQGGNFFQKKSPAPTTYDECVKAGYPIQESFPQGCQTPDGQIFYEDVGNIVEKERDGLIMIEHPRPNELVTSPLMISGQARGSWFFEASFPVKLLDGTGNIIASVPATAKGDWMTEALVPFDAIVTFATHTAATGTLILEKDNPSGLPEHADSLHFPIRFR